VHQLPRKLQQRDGRPMHMATRIVRVSRNFEWMESRTVARKLRREIRDLPE